MKTRLLLLSILLPSLTLSAASYRTCGKIAAPATQYFGGPGRTHQSAVIDISDQLEGAKSIVAIRVNVRPGDRTSDSKLIVKTSKSGDDILWEENFEPKTGWNYIRLEQPCSLKRLTSCFVGYELTTTGAAIGGWSENDPDIQVVLSGTFAEADNASSTYLEGTMSRVVSTAVPYPYTAVLVNTGNTVQNDLWPLEFKEETHDLTFSHKGAQNVSVCGFNYNVTAYGFAAPKTPLVELFTSQFCANCPAGEETMELALLHSGAKVARLYHHAGYAADAFTLTESETLATSLGVTSAPSMVVDRGGVSHPGNSTENQFRELVRDWALAGIEVNTEWNSNTLNVTADFERDASLTGHVTLETWLTQSGVKSYQSGNGTQYTDFVHNDFPLVKMESKSLGSATKQSVNLLQTVDANLLKFTGGKAQNLKVVCYALVNGKVICATEYDVPENPSGIRDMILEKSQKEYWITPFVKAVGGKKVLTR